MPQSLSRLAWNRPTSMNGLVAILLARILIAKAIPLSPDAL
jgi:hypothetical protein